MLKKSTIKTLKSNLRKEYEAGLITKKQYKSDLKTLDFLIKMKFGLRSK